MPEYHNIKPIYDKDSKILILGSFPSKKSRDEAFFYMHPQNRFWDVVSSILGHEYPESVDEKKAMLINSGIALFDVIKSCDITGSSDSSITNVVPNDIASILENSSIRAIYCNGAKAYSLFKKYISSTLDSRHSYRPILLPSTSPANASYSKSALISAWKRILIPLKRQSGTYYSMSDFSNDFYGKKLYKLSLNGGFTCPNRDGKIDKRGCIFCDGGGAGDFGGSVNITIPEQIAEQKQLIKNKLPKTKPCGYIAYFQSFTNTYASKEKLWNIYSQVINDSEIDVISIATRPDCIDEDVLEVLKRINEHKPVWIELGLQTIHKKSAEYIRRGYDLSVYEKAVKNLSLLGIDHIITHVILGLPHEDENMMLQTVSYIADSTVNGIKLQLLHVLKNTDLETEYNNGVFETLSEDQYLSILKKCLDILPDDMVVHRLSGDGNKKNLIAPLWSADKKHVINRIKNL